MSESVCLNCGALLRGPYCGRCGQKDVDPNQSLIELVGGLLREIFDLDGRVARTLLALFAQPGLLSESYLAGQRRRYTSPIRLYLVISVLFFVVVAWVARSGMLFDVNDNSLVEVNVLAEDLPRMMFVLLPFFALLLKAMFWQRSYVNHLVHALHLHTVAYISLGFVLPLEHVATGRPFLIALQALPFLYLLGYMLLSLRRVYRASWLVTVLKAAMVACSYIIALGVSLEAAVWWQGG